MGPVMTWSERTLDEEGRTPKNKKVVVVDALREKCLNFVRYVP